MVVDTIKKLIFYFVNSKEPNEFAAETTTITEAPTTMSTEIAANDDDDVQSLYSIVENGLKDNVSIDGRVQSMQKSIDVFTVYMTVYGLQWCVTKFFIFQYCCWCCCRRCFYDENSTHASIVLRVYLSVCELYQIP